MKVTKIKKSIGPKPLKETEQARRIAFDTNFLVYMIKQKADAFEQIEDLLEGHKKYFVPDQVMAEIDRMDRKPKGKKLAALIRSELNRNEVRKIGVLAGNADKALLELAKKDFMIASNDKVLKERVKKANGRGLHFRQAKRVDIY